MRLDNRNNPTTALTLVAFVCAACSTAPNTAPAPETHVRLEQPAVTPAAPTASAPLPNLPPMGGGATLVDAKGPRVQELHAVDEDFGLVVRQLATRFGYQFQMDPSVKPSRVNTSLKNTSLTEALDAIMPQGVGYELRGGVLRVGPARLETRIFTLDYVALSRVGTANTVIQRRLINGEANGSSRQNADVISQTSVADAWEEVRIAVEAMTFDQAAAQASADGGTSTGRAYSRNGPDGRRLIVNPMAGVITVTAAPSRLDQIDRFIKTFEASVQRQVLIEAKIVEVSLDRSYEFGIDWNVVTSNTATKLSSGPRRGTANVEFTLSGGTQISAVLNALSSQGDVKVLSSPRVSALNNQRAVFDVTTAEIVFNLTRQPIVGPSGTVSYTSTVTPTQVNVGIVLDVLPQIGADNAVTMNIRPTVTSVARRETFVNSDGTRLEAPVIDTRESDTMARLRAGETIIIGGLMQNRREKVKSGVPILRSIPLLGRAFSRTVDVEHKAELVIFLTPTIIAGQLAPGR